MTVGKREKKKELDILIVDDLAQWRKKLVTIIKKPQYSIKIATSYTEALQALATNNFKLAILDMKLVDSDEKNKDGLRLLADIDKANLDIKVIIITAYGTEEDEETARRSQKLLDFINKRTMQASKFRDLVHQTVG